MYSGLSSAAVTHEYQHTHTKTRSVHVTYTYILIHTSVQYPLFHLAGDIFCQIETQTSLCTTNTNQDRHTAICFVDNYRTAVGGGKFAHRCIKRSRFAKQYRTLYILQSTNDSRYTHMRVHI
jgi:hypothetical protein